MSMDGLRDSMLSTRIKVKVQQVKAIRDIEGRESFQIDFAEVRSRPPVGSVTPTQLPDDIGQMVVQITKGMQQVMPGGSAKEYEFRKLTMIFTADELEAFKLKPYPNQLYELNISNGVLEFKEI